VPRGAVVVLGQRRAEPLRAQPGSPRSSGRAFVARGSTLDFSRATGSAYVDFPKLGQALGKPLGWFMSWLLAGERRVQVRRTSARAAAGPW